MTSVKPQTVYDLLSAALEKGDSRIHRRINAHWLKQYMADGTDAADKTPEDWEDLAKCARGSVERKKNNEIEAAVRVLESAVNGADKDLVIANMANMHTTLLDSLATTVLDAINFTRYDDGSFDGRIGAHFQKFIRDHFIFPVKKR